MRKLLISTFILFAIIYYLSSAGQTSYDYFTRLASSFVQGKFYLTESPSWLNELVPIGDRFYVVYPPMPAIACMPFVILLGNNFQQQYLAHLMGAGIVVLFMAIAYKISQNYALVIWSGLLVGCSTILWHMSAVGSAWYLGQISAAFFLTAGIYSALGHKKALLTGVFVGAAYLSRLHTILALPLFLYLYKEKRPLKNYLALAAGISPFIIFNLFYNYSRFGVFWDKGYVLIPGVLDEPWFNHGLFSPSYIPRHLRVIFGALPRVVPKIPLFAPSQEGLAIWITTPAFIYAVFTKWKAAETLVAWVSILLIGFVIFCHSTTGFSQFGYRYAVDFYPILIFLTIKSAAKGPKWHHWVLLAIGILVNTWGVIWINKFGWVV